MIASHDGGIKTATRVGKDIWFWEDLAFDLSTEL
jgi:hypothetical protein